MDSYCNNSVVSNSSNYTKEMQTGTKDASSQLAERNAEKGQNMKNNIRETLIFYEKMTLAFKKLKYKTKEVYAVRLGN